MQIERQQLKQRFQEIFGSNHEPMVVRSPGRVNIIGEHTDYNDWFVPVSYTHLDVYKRQN